jgi:hypothetical protein
MDYDAIAAHFLAPSSQPIPEPKLPNTPARRLRDSLEAIATVGWWSRAAADGITGLGHGFFDGYLWGRAASLGADVAPSVVVGAFGVFEPGMVTATLQHGRSVSSQSAILAARDQGAADGLAACLNDAATAALPAISEPLLDAMQSLDTTARPLFAGLRSLPLPESATGRAWRAAEMVREHRGDGHLAACVAAGLDAIEMNVLTELWLGYAVGDYSATRGFSPDALKDAVARLATRGWVDAGGSTITSEGRAAREALEQATDQSQAHLLAALGDQLDGVVSAAEVVSAAVLRAQAAPSDPRKRAAG